MCLKYKRGCNFTLHYTILKHFHVKGPQIVLDRGRGTLSDRFVEGTPRRENVCSRIQMVQLIVMLYVKLTHFAGDLLVHLQGPLRIPGPYFENN